MLLLVLGNNFVLLYLGWEGVGLASYLLIGFYQDRPSAATAAKKAFLMNRVGDVGLALAIFILWTQLGTLQYTEVFANVGRIDPTALVAITLLLLLGACGKSGQFPLQAWLPDAMEGPTPVSALIHAATMVTAGVYLVARMNPLYDLTETGQVAVAIIGTITLLIGAIIGCAYDDIKKVLAYSTVSQIGYMFLAVGLGPYGYALGIAHLLAHGFFKAGLFLGAGSVMHAMNDNVDMRHYGGLARVMPITFVTFGLGYLALIGFPPLSGYFTKDAIIEAAFAAPGWQGWTFGLLATIAAGLTAFYMTRLMFMTFFGEKRWKNLQSADGHAYHPHESPSRDDGADDRCSRSARSARASSSPRATGSPTGSPRRWASCSSARARCPRRRSPRWCWCARRSACSSRGWRSGGGPRRWSARGTCRGPCRPRGATCTPTRSTRRSSRRPAPGCRGSSSTSTTAASTGWSTASAALLGGSSGRLRRLQTGFVRSYALTMLGGAVLVVAALLAVRFV